MVYFLAGLKEWVNVFLFSQVISERLNILISQKAVIPTAKLLFLWDDTVEKKKIRIIWVTF